MGEIINFWKENIKKHYKLLSAILTEMVITVFIILTYAYRSGLDIGNILFIMVISVQGMLFLGMRLIGKGEVENVKELLDIQIGENDQLKLSATYNRDLSEYRLQIAIRDAIIANKEWVDSNELLKKEPIKPTE